MLSKVTLALGSLGMVLLTANAIAGESQDFQSYLSYAKGKAHMASDAQHNFKPAETFKNYNPHPSETGYYGGDKQEKTTLPGAGIAAAKSNDAGKAVDDNFLTRPQYEVNSTDPAITQAKFVQQHSYNISRGISDQYVDCTKKDFCKTTYSNQSCVRSKQFDLACHQDLTVQVAPAIVKKFTAKFSEQSSNVGVFTSPYSGKITAISVGLGSYHAFHCNITYVGKILGTIVGQSYTG